MADPVEVSMRNRIARALWLNRSIAKNKVALWDGTGLTDFDKQPYFDAADAVLSEMMKPTKAMIFNGMDAMCRDDLEPTEDEFRAGFIAAIHSIARSQP